MRPQNDALSQAAGYARQDVQLDAIFLSPHKFIGGVGTPGVLVAKKRLFENALPPHTTGGGAVSDLPCNVRREGGKSLVIKGQSLVILEGKACDPL